jgi:Ethanolamine utilization protein EutJ (predicted chaperonin)
MSERRDTDTSGSILVRQHDGQQSLGDRGVGWVGRVSREVVIVVVDFEEEPLPLDLQRTEVVLAVGVVVLIEAVELGHRFQDLQLAVLPEGDHPSGHN